VTWTRKPYCSLDDVKALLNKRSSTDDDFITSRMVEAQAWIDERLGFSFQTDGTATAPASRLYNGNDHEQLLVDRCVSFSSVLVRTYLVVAQPGGGLVRSFTTDDITGDVLLGPAGALQGRDPGFILERLTGLFPLGRQNIEVQGVFGYPTIPSDIARACARLAGHYLQARDAGYEDKTAGGSQTTYGTKVFRADAVPPDVCEMVDRHRRRVFRA